jgi:hypothetical protein
MMHLFPLTAIVCVMSVMPLSAVADPLPDPALPKGAKLADGVHVQPRGETFSPDTADENAVQKRIRIFNEEQGRLDADFDKKLKICRGC